MPIPFTCPYCGLQSNVADQFAGQSGPCARCGNTITVPTKGGGPVPAPAAGATVAAAPKSNAALIVVVLAVVFLGAICVIGMLVALLLPAVGAARNAAQTTQCTNNMKQIAIAMHNYHDLYGSLPPAYIADENGQPMHSWRVLLLPFLGQQFLYDQYNFDEPWDGPNNSQLSYMMPDVYRCPQSTANVDETTYVAVNGAGFLFDGEKSTRMRDIIDGTSNTIMFVEADANPVEWMSPDDLPWNTAGIPVTSAHQGRIHAAMADASVLTIDQLSEQDLEAGLTIGGGEPVSIRP